jgi:pimeloyl-ACP methyl ester carboxylesterase
MSLLLLPGMGADESLYHGPWRALPDTRFLNWPEYRGERTLPQVAQRIIREYSLTSQDIPGGSSLGGMVALEIAAELGCSTACLIGSALAKEEVNPLLRAAEPLAELTPWKFAKLIAKMSRGRLPQSFARADAGFLRAMCHAIAEWPGVPEAKFRIVRIHGTHDWVIRCPEDAHKVPGAGHAIAWSHAEECVALVRRYVLGGQEEPAA